MNARRTAFLLLPPSWLALAFGACSAPADELDAPTFYRTNLAMEVNELSDAPRDPALENPCECESTIPGRCTLRAAVMTANLCPGDDVIEFGVSGTYALTIGTGTDDDDWQGDLDIIESVIIKSKPGVAATIDAAAINDRIFDIHSTTAYATLSGFKAMNGDLDPSPLPVGDAHGGCIRARNPVLNLVNVILGGDVGEGCRGHSGGGLYVENSEVFITSSIFADNDSTAWIQGLTVIDGLGGGIYAEDSSLVIEGSHILNNSSTGGAGGIYHGGANESDLAQFFEVTIDGNETVKRGGGGMMLSSFQMLDSVVSNNLVNDASEHGGGGLYVGNLQQGASFVERSTFHDNDAPVGGGLSLAGMLDVRESDFYRNDGYDGSWSSTPGGGAIVTFGGSWLNLERSSLHSNEADNGAALYVAGEVWLTNNTIYANQSDDDGGGIHVAAGAAAQLQHCTIRRNNAQAGEGGGLFAQIGADVLVENTILYGNTEAVGLPECAGPVDTSTRVVSDPGSCVQPAASIIQGSTQGWGTPTYGGQPTLAVPIVWPNVALDAASPCGAPIDQWGVARNEELCDIGSYEAL